MPRTDPTMHGVGTTHFPRKRHERQADKPASRPEHAPGGQDEPEDEDFEIERNDPTFSAPPVPKGDVDLPDVEDDEPVQYGGDAKDRKQSKATFDPADVEDESQGI